MIKRIYISRFTRRRTVVAWKGITRVRTVSDNGIVRIMPYLTLFKDQGLI